jgi:YvrJ-like protein
MPIVQFNWLDFVPQLGEFIKSVGFPVAITVYLIVRLDGLMGTIRDQLVVQTELLRCLERRQNWKDSSREVLSE